MGFACPSPTANFAGLQKFAYLPLEILRERRNCPFMGLLKAPEEEIHFEWF